jgi:hypothetical protein
MAGSGGGVSLWGGVGCGGERYESTRKGVLNRVSQGNGFVGLGPFGRDGCATNEYDESKDVVERGRIGNMFLLFK